MDWGEGGKHRHVTEDRGGGRVWTGGGAGGKHRHVTEDRGRGGVRTRGRG